MSTEKTEPVVVRIYIHTGYAGASHEYTDEFPRDEWNAMTPTGRREYLDDWAKTEMENRIEYGWSIEDEDDYAATEGVEQAKSAHDLSQPTPPFPLAEGDKVTLTVDATVYALPDPEDEPGEGYYVFSAVVNGQSTWPALTQDEVIARVRKP